MRAVVPALIAGGLLFAGCQESEQDQVRSTVTRFIDAYAAGDANAVCATLTPEVQKAFDGGCEAGVKKDLASLGEADKQRLRTLKVTKVSVSGDRARARIEGQGGEPGTLRKVDGKWLIENR